MDIDQYNSSATTYMHWCSIWRPAGCGAQWHQRG